MLSNASSHKDPQSSIQIGSRGLFREITKSYQKAYSHLMDSGLYGLLLFEHLIIPHEEAYYNGQLVIEPELVNPISYPYEWSFTQLKAAALATLRINELAIGKGLILKDASAFNMQYHDGNWTLIDTGSFDIYKEGQVWGAYGQFLRHFLCPLVLASYGNKQALKTLITNIDGLSVAEYSRMLPVRSWFLLTNLLNIHSHRFVGKATGRTYNMSKFQLQALMGSLKNSIEKLTYNPKSEWVEYPESTEYVKGKKNVVEQWLIEIGVRHGLVLDIGANTGDYSSIAWHLDYEVVAIDREHDCIDAIAKRPNGVLPLVVDITNPTPAIGWANMERASFVNRVSPDVVMALAVIHHICITNNVPLELVAQQFSNMTKKYAIVEFVSPLDDNSKRMATNHVFPEYNEPLYRAEFWKYFELVKEEKLTDCRSLFLWRKS